MRHQASAKAKFLAALRENLSVEHAARSAGFSRQTAYRWRAEDPEFAADWDEARDCAIDTLEQSAYEKALNGDTTMQIFMLKCHRPQIYRDHPRGSHPATEPARPALTWSQIFPEGEKVDIASEEAWKTIASRLGDMPITDALGIVAKCLNEILKLRLLQQKGASGQMLQEIRKMAQDLFGESAPVDEREDGEDDD